MAFISEQKNRGVCVNIELVFNFKVTNVFFKKKICAF